MNNANPIISIQRRKLYELFPAISQSISFEDVIQVIGFTSEFLIVSEIYSSAKFTDAEAKEHFINKHGVTGLLGNQTNILSQINDVVQRINILDNAVSGIVNVFKKKGQPENEGNSGEANKEAGFNKISDVGQAASGQDSNSEKVG